MTRGRKPLRALRLAAAIAEQRGEVQVFAVPDQICSFVIYCAGLVALVRVKRMRRLRCTFAELEREVAAELASLRMIVSSAEISRELWICSTRANFRYFRVTQNGLVELDCTGRPLPADKAFTPKSPYTVKAVPALSMSGDLTAPAIAGNLSPAQGTPFSESVHPEGFSAGKTTHSESRGGENTSPSD